MRASLVLLAAGAFVTGACVVGSVAAVRAQEAASARGSAVDAETLKTAEVMRRVLVREALGTRSAAATVYQYGDVGPSSVAWNYGTSYAEFFLVPGQGATFILRTSDPVSAPSGAEQAEAATPEPTAWDEEAAALDGKPVRSARLVKGAGFEAAKVEALRNRVLDQLAKYGANVRGLAPSDSFTVIVQGGGGRIALTPGTANGARNDVQLALIRAATYVSTAAPEARTVLVIRATVADCKAAADGSLSADEFRRRAAIASY